MATLKTQGAIDKSGKFAKYHRLGSVPQDGTDPGQGMASDPVLAKLQKELGVIDFIKRL